MKKITFSIVAILCTVLSWSQIITSTPAFVTQDGGVIELIYDATLGTAGLKNYAGTDVYAHTGVITSLSATNSDWKHAPNWLDNSAKYKLISLGNNKWKFSITPSLKDFYGLATGEIVKKIAFVFRNSTASLVGKDVGGADIFFDVYQAGLQVAFTNPASNQSIAVGSNINIQASSSVAANFNLFINGVSARTATSTTGISHAYTFGTAGDYTLIVEASVANLTVRDTVKICVPEPVVLQARPAGLTDGINYNDNTTATLVLYAPGKSNVFVIGDFNEWSQQNAYQMKKDGNYWWITLSDLTPGKLYGFQYLVDGVLKVSDAYTELVLDPWDDKFINQHYSIYPNLKAYPDGKTAGLVSTLQTAKPAYNWEIPNFTMPSRDNMVIYELLLRDFTVEKSLDAAILKLDYLKNLGITAIELMPIQEFDGNNSWGYNPNHFFAPDKAYGTPDTYKKFIDECHKRGMAVILDMVFNHATGNNPFVALYWNGATNKTAANNPWFNVYSPHPYNVYHDFNHSFSGTKEFFNRVLKYWITEYKVDGYRMDLAKGFTQNVTTGEPAVSNFDQSRVTILTDYYNAAKSVKGDVMFILEFLGFGSNSDGNAEENMYASKGMYLWRNTNNAYSQSAMGYQTDSDFGNMNTSPRQWVGYAECHDEERNFYKAKMYGLGVIASDSIVRTNRVPLNIAFTTLIPGPKMIYEFGEMGFDYSINSQGGRTNPKPSAWSYLDLVHRKAAYDTSSKIINLRKLNQNAFTNGTWSLNIATADWNAGRRIALSHADLNMVVLGNFNASGSITANPNFQKTGTWYNLLTGKTLNVTNTGMTLNMQPGELLIYTDRLVNLPNSVRTTYSDRDCFVTPTISNSSIYISTSGEIKKYMICNLQGAVLKNAVDNSVVDVSDLNNGLYLLKVETTRGFSTHKIIKE